MKARNCTRTQSGSTLVTVLVVTVVILIGAMAVLQLGAQDAVLATRDLRVSEAFYAAEAGAERGVAWLRAQSTPPTVAVNPFGDYPDTLSNGLYYVTFQPDLMATRALFKLKSYATVAGKSRALEIHLTPKMLADFLYFTNTDTGPATPGYFRSGEIIDGPVHLNDVLAIWGDPVFLDDVESTSNTILYHNDWNPVNLASLSNPPHDEPDFRNGCELGAPSLPWVEQQDVRLLETVAGLVLPPSEIVFGRDAGAGPMLGYVSYRDAGGGGEWTDVLISSFNGIIYADGSCSVKGIVDGQATVVSNGHIDVVDDLIYAASDANGPLPGCDDLLGLIGGSKVDISYNLPNCTDCIVHAHIIAVDNQAILVEQYNVGSPRGTLSLFGGIAQDKWGPVGTGYYDLDGNFVVLTGYERDFHYDWRLRTMLPPGYSLFIDGIGEYLRVAWREITPVTLVHREAS